MATSEDKQDHDSFFFVFLYAFEAMTLSLVTVLMLLVVDNLSMPRNTCSLELASASLFASAYVMLLIILIVMKAVNLTDGHVVHAFAHASYGGAFFALSVYFTQPWPKENVLCSVVNIGGSVFTFLVPCCFVTFACRASDLRASLLFTRESFFLLAGMVPLFYDLPARTFFEVVCLLIIPCVIVIICSIVTDVLEGYMDPKTLFLLIPQCTLLVIVMIYCALFAAKAGVFNFELRSYVYTTTLFFYGCSILLCLTNLLLFFIFFRAQAEPSDKAGNGVGTKNMMPSANTALVVQESVVDAATGNVAQNQFNRLLTGIPLFYTAHDGNTQGKKHL
jgi:hypothetical protein